ncbi:MAG: hypothetical protein HXX80_02465 [Nitrososphaerales archaeon]|nr:hypothetical protein [Nitrososphaerales archaeon]
MSKEDVEPAREHSLKKCTKLYSFRWLSQPITQEEARALRLVQGVAIHVGRSRRQPVADEQTEDNLMRGGRSIRGALMDIDHAAFPEILPIDPVHYKEAYGLETLFPVGQVFDGEYEDKQVEFIASIWDDKVYDMVVKGQFKGCSVVEEYRNEKHVSDGVGANVTEGSTFPLLALCLEAEPAYPGTWVKPWSPETATLVPEEQAKARLQEPLIIEVPIPNTKTIKKYSLEQKDGVTRASIESVNLSDKTSDDLEDKVAHAIAKMNEKLEALKEEVRQMREEKVLVERELHLLKEDHTQLKEFGRASPTGMIEAHPARQVRGKTCDHINFLSALPEDRDVPRKLPTEIFQGWMKAVERNTQGCNHEKFTRPYTINKDFIPIKFVSQETLLNWLHNIRRVLSYEVE